MNDYTQINAVPSAEAETITKYFDVWTGDDQRGSVITMMEVPESYFLLSSDAKDAVFYAFVESGKSAAFESSVPSDADLTEFTKEMGSWIAKYGSLLAVCENGQSFADQKQRH